MSNDYPRMYPHLYEQTGPALYDVFTAEEHPLRAILLAGYEIFAGNDFAPNVAARTDHCLKLTKMYYPDWLEKKWRFLIGEKDYANVSATLGEIRAFGECIQVWDKAITFQSTGADFLLSKEGIDVLIEVHTLQKSTKDTKEVLETRVMMDNGKRTETPVITAEWSFGKPKRKGKDGVQGEAVSKIASIKGDEKQLSDTSPCILWLDFKDPSVWRMPQKPDQCLPITLFQNTFTSGIFWNAFYAKQDDRIYDSLCIGGIPGVFYLMEFNGRFQMKSKVDFVVIDFPDCKVLFQNHQSKKDLPDWLFKDLLRLSGLSLEFCWIDWPLRDSLPNRVLHARNEIVAFQNAFRVVKECMQVTQNTQEVSGGTPPADKPKARSATQL